MVDGQLGEFLRARREAVHPADVGLETGVRRRRVPGLRREEVALRSGISAEYYIRLEQGRERRPSPRVVAALARALLLDHAAEDYLRLLAGLSRDPQGRPLTTSADMAALVGSLAGTPAFAHDRVLEVIESNPLARALSPVFSPGVNLMRAVFLDSRLGELYLNLDEMRMRLVAYLRLQAAAPPQDPRLAPLVAELSDASPDFAALWARHDVTPASSGVNRIHHRLVGDFELRFERLCFAGSDDPVLVIYHAAPGTPGETALRELARLGAPLPSAQNPLDDIQSRQTSATSRQPASMVSE
ncbi:helix-turn-helix transcriptional regulator [Pseudolysinimonas kribbensis]